MNLKRNENSHRTSKTRAFTLIEALVAVSILMIAISSPMLLTQKGLTAATLSKDQMVATFLAQDAIEAVKNIRDQIAITSNFGGTINWLNGTILDNCVCNPASESCNFDLATLKYCTIDTTYSAWNKNPPAINLGDSVTPPKLKISYDASSNFIKYDYHTDDSAAHCDNSIPSKACNSKFTRYINIVKPTLNQDEAVVNVRVFWTSPQGIQKIDLQDFIYNYSENLCDSSCIANQALNAKVN